MRSRNEVMTPEAVGLNDQGPTGCNAARPAPTAEEWASAVEARAAELREGCQMPMEQARALAASEAGPDWYARGQDWGLADALTAGQDGDWTLDDIARAFAAGAQAAEQIARAELSDTALRSADHLRRAIKAEALLKRDALAAP